MPRKILEPNVQLKAYIARELDEYVCTLVHGTTPGQAKVMAYRNSGIFDFCDYVDVRLTRLPGLDNKSITFGNAEAAGFTYYEEDWDTPLPKEQFTNYCTCPICNGH